MIVSEPCFHKAIELFDQSSVKIDGHALSAARDQAFLESRGPSGRCGIHLDHPGAGREASLRCHNLHFVAGAPCAPLQCRFSSDKNNFVRVESKRRIQCVGGPEGIRFDCNDKRGAFFQGNTFSRQANGSNSFIRSPSGFPSRATTLTAPHLLH